ncbi:TniB family NTP-binding protein [Mesorhizobium kowhaii]|uniref:TniB family NTP-binding protein n=1 Tax=Mesorhizobium kowhaii TaxID=1300272 RepID=UPI0035EDBBB3
MASRVVVSGDYPHLHPAVRPFVDEATEVRVRRIRTDRWIAYARANAALAAMEDLLTFPKRMRMPNLLLVGPTNNGKTMMNDQAAGCRRRISSCSLQARAITRPLCRLRGASVTAAYAATAFRGLPTWRTGDFIGHTSCGTYRVRYRELGHLATVVTAVLGLDTWMLLVRAACRIFRRV